MHVSEKSPQHFILTDSGMKISSIGRTLKDRLSQDLFQYGKIRSHCDRDFFLLREAASSLVNFPRQLRLNKSDLSRFSFIDHT